MKHSVILVSYNRPRMIRRALTDLFRQTHGDWELFVADDGSDDVVVDTIKAMLSDDPRCRFLEGEKSPDAVRTNCAVRAVNRINFAIPLVTGDIVHYLADDDFFDINRFALFEQLFADPTVMAGYGKLMYVDGAHNLTGPYRFIPGKCADPHCALDQGQMAHRRQCFERVPRWIPMEGDYTSDGRFFRDIAHAYGPLRAIDGLVHYKSIHPLTMGNTQHTTGPVRE
jgi:glycosyltransferase involved in cell wall biosynthesis